MSGGCEDDSISPNALMKRISGILQNELHANDEKCEKIAREIAFITADESVKKAQAMFNKWRSNYIKRSNKKR